MKYALITYWSLSCHFHKTLVQLQFSIASGQRESATNRLGEHGGMGFGPMRQICKRSPRRLIVGGFSIGA
jgi:hypothetical protein